MVLRSGMSSLPKPTKLKVENERKVPSFKVTKNPSFIIKKVGILGFGEIGKAIRELYRHNKKYQIFIKDLDRNDFPKDLDLLHVCIPYNSKFMPSVMETIATHAKDALIIIHSTVKVGTTDSLSAYYPYVVHSPCSGVHPNLLKGLKTFIKFVGSNKPGPGRIASEHLEELGLKTEVVYKSKNTEAMKLWDTTYYFWCIAFQKELHRYCEKNGLNFDAVYTRWNNAYNAGYSELDRWDVVRPILKFMEGKVGGHCLVPNAKILEKDSFIPKILLNKNKDY